MMNENRKSEFGKWKPGKVKAIHWEFWALRKFLSGRGFRAQYWLRDHQY